jgi:hypothetical protein
VDRRAPSGRPARARRSGYIVAIIINGVLLYLINVRPGWQAAHFLTPAAREVVGPVDVVLALSLAVNVVYVAVESPWVSGVGDLLTAIAGLVAAIRLWQVFPFVFRAHGWSVALRTVLIIAIAGSCIAIAGLLAALVRRLLGHRR